MIGCDSLESRGGFPPLFIMTSIFYEKICYHRPGQLFYE